MANPRQLVDAPSFTPSPYGLLSVMQMPTPMNSHWQNGITYQTHCLNDANSTYDECIAVTGTGSPPPPNTKSTTTEMNTRGATPHTVYTKFDCSPVGLEDAQRVARDAMNQAAPWQVERAFWTGEADGQSVVFPHLADTTSTEDSDGITLQNATSEVVTGAGTDIACGLGLLEGALSDCYNGVGVIHVPRYALPTMIAWKLVEKRGSQLFTHNGNLVAVGGGYPGTGPDGSESENGECGAWLYATGAVFGYVSDMRIHDDRQSFDKASNTVEMIAERTYVIGWDCCNLAIDVVLGVPSS